MVEIEPIIFKYSNINIVKSSNNNYKITVKIKGRKITVSIDKGYPFTVPKIKFNNKLYIELLYFNDSYSKNILKNIFNKKCLCCDSLFCPNNWKPAKKLLDIFNEIEKNITIVEKVICIKYCYIICNSKNIYCSEIPEYIINNFIMN